MNAETTTLYNSKTKRHIENNFYPRFECLHVSRAQNRSSHVVLYFYVFFSFLCHKAPPFPDVSTSDVSGSGRGLTTKTRYEQQTDRVIGKCSSLARYARERGDDFHLINMKKKNNNIKQTDRHNLAVICVY